MSPRVTVLGTGYLGATHAACMAELGFEVLGYDIDETKIASLASGVVPFHEPELQEVLQRNLATGRLHFTTDLARVADFGDVHFICVGTPQQASSQAADMQYVDGLVEALGPLLTRPALVVGKSTVPVGSASRISARLAELAPAGGDVRLAWSPEFLREGFAVKDTLEPDRLVIGTAHGDDKSEAILREVYAPLLDAGTPLVVSDYETAELVKVAANSFLATKISFINAMAELCETVGADVVDLAQALSYDERIGGRFLHAGLGFGGGCLPKDIRAFATRADELGAGEAVAFLHVVDAINLRRRAAMVDLARRQIGGDFTDRTVAILGAAFKPNSDDVRDSPALDVARTIHELGARVRIYDPYAIENARKVLPDVDYATSVEAALTDADAVLHLTEWREFRDLDPESAGKFVAHRVIVDGRNALDPDRWREAGWTYAALGRPRS
jgi:UDPglucose 6-dehydrogenase